MSFTPARFIIIYLFISVAGPDLVIAMFAIPSFTLLGSSLFMFLFIYVFFSVAGPELVIAIFAIAGMSFTPAGFIIIYLFIYLFISVAGPDLVIAIFFDSRYVVHPCRVHHFLCIN